MRRNYKKHPALNIEKFITDNGLLPKVFFAGSQRAEYVLARAAIMKHLQLAGYTRMAIGKLLNRNHSTVTHQVNYYQPSDPARFETLLQALPSYM